MGKPAVPVTNQTYLVEESSAVTAKGMPGIRIVWDSLHSEELVDNMDGPEEVEAGIDPLLDNIIDALTRPLTEEERSPKPKEQEKPPRLFFRGTLQEVNHFFYRRGWGDGLPIIPPTEEAVKEMLTGTDMSPEHLVTTLGPLRGKATVEKIAVNAVMAGALPTHLPAIIAGTEALSEKATRWDNYQDSQGSWVPFWILSGPAGRDIHVNSGIGPLSPGDIANAAIGRAMSLIVKNIGGVRKGVEDAGSFGNPGKYTMVIAENEEASPWESFHVEHGFSQEDSTISVLFPNVFNWTFPWVPGADAFADSMARAVRGPGMYIFVLPPGSADILAEAGYTKQKLKEYIRDHYPAPVPGGDAGNRPRMSFAPDPDHITILVSGGPAGIYVASGAWIQWQEYVTKKLPLPKDWDKLVNKYKNLVPVYAKY
ncbi:MAG: hypothetical protein A2158_03875 [Chloroflexi bacterium RBG_13_46_14]|nr:MAG: hypothetical protein A2158_03875 [Chloroflexi bacterium RBG_13_46_14]